MILRMRVHEKDVTVRMIFLMILRMRNYEDDVTV
jgi:hypothetical protein